MAQFSDHLYSFNYSLAQSDSRYAMVHDGEDLIPDVRGSLSPAQVVDAKFFALVGGDSKANREEVSGSLHDRRMGKGFDA